MIKIGVILVLLLFLISCGPSNDVGSVFIKKTGFAGSTGGGSGDECGSCESLDDSGNCVDYCDGAGCCSDGVTCKDSGGCCPGDTLCDGQCISNDEQCCTDTDDEYICGSDKNCCGGYCIESDKECCRDTDSLYTCNSDQECCYGYCAEEGTDCCEDVEDCDVQDPDVACCNNQCVIKCKDSDGGDNPNTYGVIKFNGQIVARDRCFTSSGGLYEYECDGDCSWNSITQTCQPSGTECSLVEDRCLNSCDDDQYECPNGDCIDPECQINSCDGNDLCTLITNADGSCYFDYLYCGDNMVCSSGLGCQCQNPSHAVCGSSNECCEPENCVDGSCNCPDGTEECPDGSCVTPACNPGECIGNQDCVKVINDDGSCYYEQRQCEQNQVCIDNSYCHCPDGTYLCANGYCTEKKCEEDQCQGNSICTFYIDTGTNIQGGNPIQGGNCYFEYQECPTDKPVCLNNIGCGEECDGDMIDCGGGLCCGPYEMCGPNDDCVQCLDDGDCFNDGNDYCAMRTQIAYQTCEDDGVCKFNTRTDCADTGLTCVNAQCVPSSTSSDTNINGFSVYMAREDNTLDGIAYQFLPSGIQFNNPVELTLKHEGNLFYDNDGITIYRYEDDHIDKECEYVVLSNTTKVIDNYGGIIELEDAKLTFPMSSLSNSTWITIRKLNLSCDKMLINHQINQNKVSFYYTGTLPYLLKIKKEKNSDDGYVVAKVNEQEVLIDLSFTQNPSKVFYYSAESTEGIATGSFSLE